MKILRELVAILRTPFLRNVLLFSVAVVAFFPLAGRLVISPLFERFVVERAEADAVRIARFMVAEFRLDQNELAKDSLPPDFSERVTRAQKELDVAKFKVFSNLGEVLYSSNPAEIGEFNEESYFLNEVVLGKVYTKVVSKSARSLEGETVTSDVVETYVPVLTRDGDFAGAFEIYYGIGARLAALARLVSYINLASVLATLVLLGAVVVVISKAGSASEARLEAERASRESEEKFRRIAAAAKDPIIMTDDRGRIFFWNEAARDTFGYPAAEVLGKVLADFLVAHRCRSRFTASLRAGGAIDGRGSRGRVLELFALRQGGVELPVELSVASVTLRSTVSTVVILRDITERRRAQEDMMLASKVMESTHEGIAVTDAAGIIQTVNPALVSMTGYGVSELVGQNTRVLQSGRHDAAFYREMWAAIGTRGHWHGEIWNRRKDGALYPQWLSIAAIRKEDAGVSHYVGVFTDITGRKTREVHLERLAYSDALTGLPNRFVFNDRLEHALTVARRRRQGVALFFVDLDGFKSVNDTWGHNVGDLLLQEVARRLQACVEEEDTVARLGGDEFTLCIRSFRKASELYTKAGIILEALGTLPFRLDGRDLSIGASLGISLYPDDGDEAGTLLRYADEAMYAAKKSGKNRFRRYSYLSAAGAAALSG